MSISDGLEELPSSRVGKKDKMEEITTSASGSQQLTLTELGLSSMACGQIARMGMAARCKQGRPGRATARQDLGSSATKEVSRHVSRPRMAYSSVAQGLGVQAVR